MLALSHRQLAESGRLTLTHAGTRVGGLTLAMTVSRITGIPAELELSAAPGDPIELPQDLLAVLGLAWSRLQRGGAAWRGSIKLRGQDSARSDDAEAKLAHTVLHLAQTLAEPPPHFHARFARARRFVVPRRATPLLVALALIAAAALVPQLNLHPDSVWRMLIFNAPPLLLVALFSMRELPRLEIPPWPRAARTPHWREPR